eukprot:GILI01047594.1.p2 GENE.GILI01047594.1~~GILI01047594.1.p2  ORF type:complete len:248 (-),score=44.96 GILI01047594.1:10-753(-)
MYSFESESTARESNLVLLHVTDERAATCAASPQMVVSAQRTPAAQPVSIAATKAPAPAPVAPAVSQLPLAPFGAMVPGPLGGPLTWPAMAFAPSLFAQPSAWPMTAQAPGAPFGLTKLKMPEDDADVSDSMANQRLRDAPAIGASLISPIIEDMFCRDFNSSALFPATDLARAAISGTAPSSGDAALSPFASVKHDMESEKMQIFSPDSSLKFDAGILVTDSPDIKSMWATPDVGSNWWMASAPMFQ